MKSFMSEKFVSVMLMCVCVFSIVSFLMYSIEKSETWNNFISIDYDLKEGPCVSRTPVWDSSLSYNDFNLFKGDVAYFSEGDLHRVDGPAIVRKDGSDEYWLRGFRYQKDDKFDLSANLMKDYDNKRILLNLFFDGDIFRAISPNKNLQFCKDDADSLTLSIDEFGFTNYDLGQLSSDNGPAILSSLGSWGYFKNGIPTRDNGPAISYADGTKWYMKNGRFHRLDGPAIIWGDKHSCEYWIDGKQLSYDEFLNKTQPSSVDSFESAEKSMMNSIEPMPSTLEQFMGESVPATRPNP